MKQDRIKAFKKNKLAFIFFFLYPILPVYASIMSVNGRNLLCLVFLIATVLFSSRIRRCAIRGQAPTLIIFAIWIIGRFFQIMITKSFLEGVYFLLLTIAMYFSVGLLIKTEIDFLSCIKSILYASFMVSILGLVEEITHINIFSYLNREFELNYNPLRFGILRIIGFSQHTIVHGVYIMFCMSLCLYMWQFVRHQRAKKIRITILYVLLWINLFLTLSRSIILFAIVSQMFILYLMGVRKLFKVLLRIIGIGIPAILILALFIPKVGEILQAGVLMIAAVFDDRAASMISTAFGNDNLRGVGNRIDLYKWVAEEMPGHWLFGHGWNAEFSHTFQQSNGIFTWIQTKDSIEVQYLNTLYQYGVFGMITEILTFFALLRKCAKGKKKTEWEPQISFNKIAFVTFTCYFLEMFAVNQSSDRYIFYAFIILTLLYNSKRFKKEIRGKLRLF